MGDAFSVRWVASGDTKKEGLACPTLRPAKQRFPEGQFERGTLNATHGKRVACARSPAIIRRARRSVPGNRDSSAVGQAIAVERRKMPSPLESPLKSPVQRWAAPPPPPPCHLISALATMPTEQRFFQQWGCRSSRDASRLAYVCRCIASCCTERSEGQATGTPSGVCSARSVAHKCSSCSAAVRPAGDTAAHATGQSSLVFRSRAALATSSASRPR
eukprot:scaffold318795_cov33-Tisochrysis_lutea.AAC.1